MRPVFAGAALISAFVVAWSIVAKAQSGLDDTTAERAAVSEWLNRDCSSKEGLHGDENATSSFCRCFSDYLSELLTDDETRYLVANLPPTESISEKAERATLMCTAMQGQ